MTSTPQDPVLMRRSASWRDPLLAVIVWLSLPAACVNYPERPRVEPPGPGAAGSGPMPAQPPDAAGGAGGSAGIGAGGAGGGSSPDTAAVGADTGPVAIPGRPFGSHPHPYPAATIRPTGEQSALDATVRRFYDQWKGAYLKMGCGGAYIEAPGGSGATTRITNSQVHGLGMLITALLHGHDPQARTIFDGMFTVVRRFGSYLEARDNRPGNANLMSYGFTAACGQVEAPDSQTDGDQPIALALLVADRQWGSTGAVDYLAQAKATIAAMKAYEMNPRSKAPLLGDWCSLGNEGPAPFQDAAHPADFAFDHFRSYFAATADPFWKEAIESVYSIVAGFQPRHSPMTGLFPEYMMSTSGQPAPAAPGFLAEPNAGAFTADALLTLFRLASDHVIAGAADPRGKAALGRVNRWIRQTTGDDPADIARGYRLNGNSLMDGPAPEFEAAFAAAAIVDPANQAWLDALWRRLTAPTLSNGFTDTVRLLSMILVSGNWWVP
jgi:hypothetical protein